MTGSIGGVLLLGGTADGFPMNPRLVSSRGLVASAYTPTAPLVPVRTTATTTRRSESDDMWR
jgi:hypothetical protein